MKLLFVSDNGRHHKKINLDIPSLGLFIFSAVLFLIAIIGTFSYFKKAGITESEIRLLNGFDAMLVKTAKLDSQVKRLNSLGKIIADKNGIDIQAYLLSKAPAMGGLAKASDGPLTILSKQNIEKSIDDLELELELQQQRYEILNNSTISHSSSQKYSFQTSTDLINYSLPVSKGYVSSAYGKRLDPFNGNQRHHNGIDIAAKHGSKIQAIASGFVTFSGRKGAYGNVIDIHHSDSLKSRYAHLDTIKVKKGEVVRKGETIATMGKTGRATGSHLHLEVWKQNRPVNPEAYIDTALIR